MQSTFSNSGQFSEAQLDEYFPLLKNGRLNDALAQALRYLLELRLGDVHRAGFRLIMAFSDDQYLYVVVLFSFSCD